MIIEWYTHNISIKNNTHRYSKIVFINTENNSQKHITKWMSIYYYKMVPYLYFNIVILKYFQIYISYKYCPCFFMYVFKIYYHV